MPAVGEHADGRATDVVGPGEVDDLPDDRLAAGEPAAIEVEGELLQVEGNGAHGVQGRDAQDHEKR